MVKPHHRGECFFFFSLFCVFKIVADAASPDLTVRGSKRSNVAKMVGLKQSHFVLAMKLHSLRADVTLAPPCGHLAQTSPCVHLFIILHTCFILYQVVQQQHSHFE